MILFEEEKVLRLEFPDYTMKLHADSLLELSIHDEVTVNAEFIWKVKREIESQRPGTKFFILARGLGFFNVTAEAREISASKEFSGHMAAVAFYTTNYSLKLLGELYNKINKPVVTTRLFSHREPAIEWLREIMKQNRPQYPVFSEN